MSRTCRVPCQKRRRRSRRKSPGDIHLAVPFLDEATAPTHLEKCCSKASARPSWRVSVDDVRTHRCTPTAQWFSAPRCSWLECLTSTAFWQAIVVGHEAFYSVTFLIGFRIYWMRYCGASSNLQEPGAKQSGVFFFASQGAASLAAWSG